MRDELLKNLFNFFLVKIEKYLCQAKQWKHRRFPVFCL